MNCKAGDLAVVMFVDGVKVQPNVGRIVRVISRNPDAEYEGRGLCACWHIRSEGSPMFSSYGGQIMEGNIPDIAIRPIRPLEEKSATKKRATVKA